MEILPRSMRTALALAQHEQLLSTIPIFYQCGSEFIAEVALALVPERYNAGEKVAEFGQLANKMYVVFLGGVCMTALDGRHISNFTPGDHFGEINAVREQIHRLANWLARPRVRVAHGQWVDRVRWRQGVVSCRIQGS